MSRKIAPRPISPAEFAEFGDVVAARGTPDMIINEGRCARHHDLARLDVAQGRIGLSIFDSAPVRLPYQFDLVERHPLGSQTFVPMNEAGFLVIVARDENGRPGPPCAFLTYPGEAVNLLQGTWHGVLTPLHSPGRFTVIDRIGPGENLEEHRYPQAYTVVPPRAGGDVTLTPSHKENQAP